MTLRTLFDGHQVNVGLLREQKKILIRLIEGKPVIKSELVTLDGIVNLLDDIEDYLDPPIIKD